LIQAHFMMIDRIIDLAVRKRLVVFALTATACIAGWWSMRHLALDAIPDLSDTQVIIFSRWDRSPDLVEAQVTYPIVSALLGAPRVRAVRGVSDFGYSYVYVIFDEGTDLYWARARTQEHLAGVVPRLPQGVTTVLGPDATALGWIFQYALVDESGTNTLAGLRACQDWYLSFHLKSVPGVAEVAPVGGFGKQFQVNLDPNRLTAFGVPVRRVVEAVRAGNIETGGRLLEFGGSEYMVRGRGYLHSLKDIEGLVLDYRNGTPIHIRDVGEVVLGPDLRRGLADLDGAGETVSGIVVMRQGQNALEVIDRVKAKLREIEPGLPRGLKILPVYDRSDLIHRAINNLKSTLLEVILTVIIIVFLFLWHPPSALIPAITIPVAVLIAFIPFRLMGVTANIMSLAGMVDAAIVVVEQVHKGLERWEREGRPGDYQEVVLRAIKQVAGPSFFALLVIAVSFLPVLTLEAQEGRLFKPLAYTKSLSMVVAALLAITLDPALRVSLTHVRSFRFRPRWLSRLTTGLLAGRIRSEAEHPISRVMVRVYDSVLTWVLRRKALVLGGALVVLATTVPVFLRLGSEFMPPLEEGSLLYMPSTMPGISIAEAQKLLQVTDRILKQFPEVDRVLGKAGRAETATDPAPLSMLETVIILKPKDQWRRVPTWYSGWAPRWLTGALRHLTSDHLSQEQFVNEMNAALKVPGLANGWTMPIKGRIEMLSTGIRTPLGLKIAGADLAVIEQLGTNVENVLQHVEGTRSVFAERTGSGYFLDIEWDREALARHGLGLEQAQDAVQHAIGGENVTTVIQGQERYPVNVRYLRDFRSDLSALEQVLVAADDGQVQIPLAQLAQVKTRPGPAMIRDENGLLTGQVYIDVSGSDLQGYLARADRALKARFSLPAGYALLWSGEYEAMQRVSRRLQVIVPLTLLLIFFLIHLNTGSLAKTMIVLLAVPFSAVGAVWLLYLLGYNLNVAVWVGLIALLGVDAETGVFMLIYLDLAYQQAKSEGRLRGLADLRQAIRYGAVQRLRPKVMTVATMFIGLVPIMWSTGTGSDVMKRIAAPMVGGIFTSFILELLVYPSIYELWKWHTELKPLGAAQLRPKSGDSSSAWKPVEI
ncbi:MAG: CusA/CzcA family heavy metal efflux RND transporter, partial [Verrucomicrobia bacterium]|nr:CusA/CzcA family heavy metal efflux RND transporter [Verrucomicrobiota bacterium]